MAGDWIKVEKLTPDKPEIRHISRMCGVSLGDAFAAWFRLWAWLDGTTDTGNVDFLTPSDCDEIGRLAGLGKALSRESGCGWIEFHPDGGAIVLSWERHNGDNAKKRAMNNRKVSAYRERTGHKPEARPWKV